MLDRIYPQNGGITIVDTIDERGQHISYSEPEKILNFFLRNSTIKKQSKGAYGRTFICTFLHTTIKSPYVVFRRKNFAKRANNIILKINFISARSVKIRDPITASNSSTNTPAEIKREIKLQTEIVEKTIEYLEPITVPIVSSNLLTNNTARPFLSLLHSRMIDRADKAEVEFIQRMLKSNSNITINCIAMEIARNDEGFQTLASFIPAGSNDVTDQYRSVALFEIIQLALSGYVQGDHHYGNILLSNKYSGYFSPTLPSNNWCTMLRCFIIDFGRARKLNLNEINSVGQYWNQFLTTPDTTKLRSVLLYIYNRGCYLDDRVDDFGNFFGRDNIYTWITQKITNNIADNIVILNNSRNNSISNFQITSQSLFRRFQSGFSRMSSQEQAMFSLRSYENFERQKWDTNLIQFILNQRYNPAAAVVETASAQVETAAPVEPGVSPTTSLEFASAISRKSVSAPAAVPTAVIAAPRKSLKIQFDENLMKLVQGVTIIGLLLFVAYLEFNYHRGGGDEDLEDIDYDLIIEAINSLNCGYIAINNLEIVINQFNESSKITTQTQHNVPNLNFSNEYQPVSLNQNSSEPLAVGVGGYIKKHKSKKYYNKKYYNKKYQNKSKKYQNKSKKYNSKKYYNK